MARLGYKEIGTFDRNRFRYATTMPRRIVPAQLWARLEPTLPQRTVGAFGGRPALSDREVLEGVLFVLRHNIRWEQLPQTLGYGSGMTCFRRLREWQSDGTWRRMERVLKRGLPSAARIDWERAWASRSKSRGYRWLKHRANSRRGGRNV